MVNGDLKNIWDYSGVIFNGFIYGFAWFDDDILEKKQKEKQKMY